MKILHLSDTHGVFPTPMEEDHDVIVHSGDMLPNRTYGTRVIEEPFQTYWLEEAAPKLHPRWWAKPVLITPGNHDFIDAVPILRAVGIDARRLIGFLDVDGVGFWGHPWTPTFCDWNWMCGVNEMRGHLLGAVELMDQGAIDVFVSHGPMFGVLDRNDEGERCGCKVLRKTLQTVRHPPNWLLHGHIHEAGGVQGWSRGVSVSNAARSQRVIEVSRSASPREPG